MPPVPTVRAGLAAAPLRFRIVADLCPQVTLRLLGLVARLNQVPRHARAARGRRVIVVEIVLDDAPGIATDRLRQQLAAVVGVRRVRRLPAEPA